MQTFLDLVVSVQLVAYNSQQWTSVRDLVSKLIVQLTLSLVSIHISSVKRYMLYYYNTKCMPGSIINDSYAWESIWYNYIQHEIPDTFRLGILISKTYSWYIRNHLNKTISNIDKSKNANISGRNSLRCILCVWDRVHL